MNKQTDHDWQNRKRAAGVQLSEFLAVADGKADGKMSHSMFVIFSDAKEQTF